MVYISVNSKLHHSNFNNFQIFFHSKFLHYRAARKHRKHLKQELNRWPHKEGVHKEDPPGCGFPICVDVDMRPKRFESMCRFVKWLKENGHERRIFAVQKGGCEDVSKLIRI